MADIKLFQIQNSGVTELTGQSVAVEKSLQNLIEKNLEAFLGVRFLDSEHTTGKNHGGRIDTLGIDENGFPVIIEYKRALNENVINQGLFYLNWLMDHQAEFELMVLKKFGQNSANQIDWSNPRLLCIAGDFTKYDEHAVQQINHNIELLRYRRYGSELLLLELVNAVSAQSNTPTKGSSLENSPSQPATSSTNKSVSLNLDNSPDSLKDLFFELDAFITALGDDVQKKTLKLYFAYKRIKNFACVEVHPFVHRLLVFVKVNPDSIVLEHGFTRDVRTIGHFGTGDLEIRISNRSDLEKAKSLIVKSYEES
jgi:predicted transport protein